MSDFVNYQKRDINLPPGCKDLIDVLIPEGASPEVRRIPQKERATVQRGTSVRAPLSAMREHVGRIVSAQAEAAFLMITASDERFTLNVIASEPGGVTAYMAFGCDPKREKTLRALLSAKGLKVPTVSDMPASFSPQLPVESYYPISPLSAESVEASELLREVLVRVWGLNEHTELCFRQYEVG